MKIYKIAGFVNSLEERDFENLPFFYKKPFNNAHEWKQDWLQRHRNLYQGSRDVYIMYHGMPKEVFENASFIQSGSLLSKSQEDSIHYTKRDRDLDYEDIVVFQLTLKPKDFNIGIFPSLNEDIAFNDSRVKTL